MALIPGNALTKFQVPKTDLGGLTLSNSVPLWGFFSRVSITEPFFINFYKENTNMLDHLAKRYHLSNIFFKRVRQSPLNRVKCLTKRLIK